MSAAWCLWWYSGQLLGLCNTVRKYRSALAKTHVGSLNYTIFANNCLGLYCNIVGSAHCRWALTITHLSAAFPCWLFWSYNVLLVSGIIVGITCTPLQQFLLIMSCLYCNDSSNIRASMALWYCGNYRPTPANCIAFSPAVLLPIVACQAFMLRCRIYCSIFTASCWTQGEPFLRPAEQAQCKTTANWLLPLPLH